MPVKPSISLLRRADRQVQSPTEVFRYAFARNLTSVLTERKVIPETEVNKVEKLAALLGTDASIVSSWLAGRELPDALDLQKIGRLLDVPIDLLLNPGSRSPAPNQVIDEEYHCITVHDASAEDGYSFYTLPETLRHLKLPRCTAMLTVPDDAMSPAFRTGDVAIYDSRVTSITASGVYVFRENGVFFVRRAVRVNSTHINLLADNASLPVIEKSVTDFTGNPENESKTLIVGRVVGRINIGNF